MVSEISGGNAVFIHYDSIEYQYQTGALKNNPSIKDISNDDLYKVLFLQCGVDRTLDEYSEDKENMNYAAESLNFIFHILQSGIKMNP